MSRTTRAVTTALVLAGVAVSTAGPALARPADATGPVITFRPIRYVVGTTLSSGSTTDAGLAMAFSWTQHDPDGFCQRTSRLSDTALGGDYPDIRPNATSYTADIGQTAAANSVVLDLATTDCAGNASSGAVFQTMTTQLVQQDAFTRSGGWQVRSCGCASGGSVISSTRSGATATYRFVGNAVALIGSVRSAGGRAEVRLDGAAPTVVDTRGARTDRVVLAQAHYPTQGSHTITVTALGAAPVVLDALAVSAN